jgi:hypothetical protein
MTATSRYAIPLGLLIALLTWSCNRDVPEAPPQTSQSPEDAPPTERVVGPLSEADAAALKTMTDQLTRYVELHNSIEAKLPTLGKDASPEQLDKNQREFERMIRQARAGAKRGDLFTPQAEPVIRRLMSDIFAGAEGRQLKDSILDENAAGAPLAVNARYPDSVPISTMPPQVLQTLPDLTEDLEYRFIGHSLIIFDVHAHTVADYLEHILPE